MKIKSTTSPVEAVAEGMFTTELGEAEAHDRQTLISSWKQDKISNARIGVIGAGGLGSKYLVNLSRMGIGRLVFCDDDLVELSNLNRQSFYPEQKFKPKALAMLDNLKRECISNTVLEAYPMYFQNVIVAYPEAFAGLDLIACLVDNEKTRLDTAVFGIEHEIPVLFSAISRTSLNGYVFLQVNGGPCYSCVSFGDPDEGKQMCADPSVIYTHTTVMGIATYATVALLQGWKLHWNYYGLILDGDSFTFSSPKQADCKLYGGSP